jgi:phosphatidylglycerophosphate synthase
VRTVDARPVIGLSAQIALLAALTWSVGLSGFGWAVGIASGVITNVALARGVVHHGAAGLGPADRVTLTRATLVGGVAAFVADSFWRPAVGTPLIALIVVALVLDTVDGWVARRTGTVSALGARFDMEVDAFLILVLSCYVARSTGTWVLAIGAARYAFAAARWVLPWLCASAPPRYWGKVVAATQGIVLTVVAANVLPHLVALAALAGALGLLVESFGHEVSWLWRHRPAVPERCTPAVVRLRPSRVQLGSPVGVRNG